MGLNGECVEWLKQRTNLEKTLMALSVILLLTCFLVIVCGITYGKDGDRLLVPPICSSKRCFETGGLMLSLMKPNIDPCENFYEYACGQYALAHTSSLDQHKSSVNQQSADSVRLSLKHWFEIPSTDNELSVFKKVKTLYRTCLEYDSQEDNSKALLLEVMRDQMIGNWPALDPFWEEPDLKLEQMFASFILLDVPAGFKFDVVLNSSSSDSYMIKISPGGPLFLHDDPRDDPTDDPRDDPMLRSYFINVLMLLGEKKDQIESVVNHILSMESTLFKMKMEADEMCIPEGKAKGNSSEFGITTVDLEKLHGIIPELNWTSMLLSINRTLNIEGDLTMEVYCRRYIRQYFKNLRDASPMILHDYIGYRFLFTFINHLGPSFKKLHGDYIAYFSRPIHPLPTPARWKECVMLVEQYMLPVVAAAFVQQKVSPAVVDESKRITSNLKSSFEHLLSSLSWLEMHERQRSKQKVSELQFEIGLMKYEAQSSHLDQLFSNLELNNGHLIHNIMRLQKFIVMKRFKKLVKPKQEDDEWKNLSLTSSVNNLHFGNLISLHFDQVRPPFLRIGQPGYLNYGSIGYLLSHKLVQSVAGLKFGPPKHNQKPLWDLGQERKNLSSCFANQYSQYKIDEINTTINGWRTLTENLADNSAIWIAYNAYERYQSKNTDEKLPGVDFGNEQIFFLSFAQSFCEVLDIEGFRSYINSTVVPAKVKVNAVLSNFPKFAEIYSCDENSPLKPVPSCNIW